jgi:DNA (cytosine-5)-methyltransferase 1
MLVLVVIDISGVDEHEITAVEWDEELARLYQERFPSDKVIVADAHQYLLENFRNFDFIWTSPPCPSHSRAAFGSRKSIKASHKPIYPDMKLYQEIVFLKHYFDGKYVVENVIPYYDPLIPAIKRGRHLYWTNFNLPNVLSTRKSISMEDINEVGQWCIFHDYNFRKYKGKQTVQKIARNLVDYEAGKTILDTVMGLTIKQNVNQTELF